MTGPLLEIRHLSTHYVSARGTRVTRAVDDVTLSLDQGQTLGIVRDGEPRVLAYLSIGALKELLYQAVTLGLAEESADVLTQQMYLFLREGYLKVAGPEPAKRPKARRSPA